MRVCVEQRIGFKIGPGAEVHRVAQRFCGGKRVTTGELPKSGQALVRTV